MRAAVAAILILCLASNAEAGRFSALIAQAAASTRPNGPAPVPTPSGKCENCDGTGIVGDGTIKNTCLVCNGTGKATTALASGTLSPGGQWRWSGRAWVQVAPVTSATNAQARGHWEQRTVCRNGGRNCDTFNVWIAD